MNKQSSDNYTVEAPLSFTGSARRLWLKSDNTYWRIACVVFFIPLAWCVVLLWYSFFGLWVIPYRLVRRSQRNRKLLQLRHKELLEGVKNARD